MPSVTYYNDPRTIGLFNYRVRVMRNASITRRIWEVFATCFVSTSASTDNDKSGRSRSGVSSMIEIRPDRASECRKRHLVFLSPSISHHRKRRLRVPLTSKIPSGSLAVRVVSRCSITTISHQSYALFTAYLLRR